MSGSFHFETVDLLTVGTLGPRGQRVFYLQCKSEGELVSLKFEKHQAAALAEYLDRVLDQLPPTRKEELSSDLDLREPVIEAWTIGALGIAYDASADRVMLVAEEHVNETEDTSSDRTAASARFLLTRPQVKMLAVRARSVVAAGRKPCAYCQSPLEPGNGDWCPCHN